MREESGSILPTNGQVERDGWSGCGGRGTRDYGLTGWTYIVDVVNVIGKLNGVGVVDGVNGVDGVETQ